MQLVQQEKDLQQLQALKEQEWQEVWGVQNLLGKAGSKVGGLEGQKAVMSALTPERLSKELQE